MKEKCLYHPDRDALSFCHSCGKHFCGECLTEGLEYYYCRNKGCQVAKARDEHPLLAERQEKKRRGETAASAADMRAFCKHSYLFLLLGFPLYLGAVDIMLGPRPFSFGYLLLAALLLGAEAFIASSVAGFVLYTAFFKDADKTGALRRNGISTAVVSFVVFLLSFEQMRGTDIRRNAPEELALIVCAVTYAVFWGVSRLLLKGRTKEVGT